MVCFLGDSYFLTLLEDLEGLLVNIFSSLLKQIQKQRGFYASPGWPVSPHSPCQVEGNGHLHERSGALLFEGVVLPKKPTKIVQKTVKIKLVYTKNLTRILKKITIWIYPSKTLHPPSHPPKKEKKNSDLTSPSPPLEPSPRWGIPSTTSPRSSPRSSSSWAFGASPKRRRLVERGVR